MECLKLNNSKIIIIIQCRDNSRRFPKKSVRHFEEGKSILEIILDRLQYLPFEIVVTTSFDSPQTLKQAMKAKVYVDLGDEGDVLHRFAKIVKDRDIDGVIRICADNPFVQPPLMYPVIVWAQDNDYVSFFGAMQRHEGFWVEYISKKALLESDRILTKDDPDREHVARGIYSRPHMYKVKWLDIPDELNRYKLRLTVDTASDFFIAKKMWRMIGRQHWFNILGYAVSNPEMYNKMQENIEKNAK
jgi:spore coat polysaccharide biosynthesis protein SpsF